MAGLGVTDCYLQLCEPWSRAYPTLASGAELVRIKALDDAGKSVYELKKSDRMWSSLPDELVLCILRMMDDATLPTVTQLDTRWNGFARERLSSLQRLTEAPFKMKTSHIFGAEVLDFVTDFGEMQQLENVLADMGMTALADTLRKGGLAQLTRLFLGRNQIGDAGLSSLAAAVANRALDKLEVRWRLTALFLCLEPWHTHSPDSYVLFDVQCPGAMPFQQQSWRHWHHRPHRRAGEGSPGPLDGVLAPHCLVPMP